MLRTLRKAGGSMVITVPRAFIEQNGLREGSQVELHLNGRQMTVKALAGPQYKLAPPPGRNARGSTSRRRLGRDTQTWPRELLIPN